MSFDSDTEVKLGKPVKDVVDSIRKGEPDRAKYHTERILQLIKEKPPEEAASILGDELAKLDEKIVEDPLTHLKKHNAGIEILDQQVALAKKLGHPLSVAVLDLDKFKEVNDRMGHDAGNTVLKAWGVFC